MYVYWEMDICSLFLYLHKVENIIYVTYGLKSKYVGGYISYIMVGYNSCLNNDIKFWA